MNSWYIISVWTGKENHCIDNLKEYCLGRSIYDVKPFVPMKETYFKKNGIVIKESSIFFQDIYL